MSTDLNTILLICNIVGLVVGFCGIAVLMERRLTKIETAILVIAPEPLAELVKNILTRS